MDDPYPSYLLIAQVFPYSFSFLLGYGLVLLFFFLGAMLCSGAEVAFFSLSQDDLTILRQRHPKKGTQMDRLLTSPRELLSSLMLMQKVCILGSLVLSTYLFTSYFKTLDPLTFLVGILVQGLGIVVGIELLPKMLAQKSKIGFVTAFSPVIYILNKAVLPLSSAILAQTKAVERRIQQRAYSLTVAELNQALELNTAGTPEEEKEILRGIVNFGTLTVRQVMKSRMEISAIELGLDFHELMDKINKSGYSRIPVYQETIDSIKGILYIKDVLPHIDKDESFDWSTLVRKSFFVPENKKVDALLKDFQKMRVHMAIVVDEYGGTSGLITLEDLLEEIIGEIHDEFDEPDTYFFQELDQHTFLFEGKISLHDFCKKLDLDPQLFEEVKGESESLGGLLLELNAKLPKNGAKIIFNPFEFTVLAVDSRKIKKVKVHLRTAEKDDLAPFTD